MPIVVVAFVAGCGERAIAPTSPLAPSARASDGLPPPPPIAADDGFGDLSVFPAGDGSLLTCSQQHVSFQFSYQYLQNGPANNAYLHITQTPGNGLDASIHQTANKHDANGKLSGPGFTFVISSLLAGGNIIGDGIGAPSDVELSLAGTLITPDGSCAATARLSLQLGESN
jgi:hypothetical protein